MRKLKSQMQKILNGVCPNVYFENAPDNASMPYMVYDLTEGNYNEVRLFTLWMLMYGTKARAARGQMTYALGCET